MNDCVVKYIDVSNPKYIEAASKAKAEIKSAKRRFEKKLAENTKSLCVCNNTKVSVGPILNELGALETDLQTVAEELNKYFSSVFTKDVHHIPDSADANMNLTSNLNDLMIDERLVQKTLQKLRSKLLVVMTYPKLNCCTDAQYK